MSFSPRSLSRSGVQCFKCGERSTRSIHDAKAMSRLPSGIVTFLFTDLEGSTRLWEEHPEQMQQALALHNAIIERVIGSNQGHVFKSLGDGFCAAFESPDLALASTVQAQLELADADWPEPAVLKARMGLYTGSAEPRYGDYHGAPVNRAARLMAIGHGGQVLVSRSTRELLSESSRSSVNLLDHGLHRLKDLMQPEQVFEVILPGTRRDFPALRSLGAYTHNLPQQLTSFVGRERELASVRDALAAGRLVTLAGSGGAGKTRLALQAAVEVMDEFPDGVWLVELASLTDSALVPRTVAAVFNLPEAPGREPIDSIVSHLRSRNLLLVLDNCEHLVDACARLAEAILRSCAEVRILATTREALGVAGETALRIPSLSLPDEGSEKTAPLRLDAAIMKSEAGRLFAERASAGSTGFAVTSQNAAAVLQICRQLDGIPLAIELAAARVRVLSVEQIAQRLDDRFMLLTGGSRTALPRQQTLRAAIDWSHDLLSQKEQLLMHRLSVFAGGWTLEAVEWVCSDPPESTLDAGQQIEAFEALDLISNLVEKSLVLFDEEAGRYRFLETVRQYSRDRLMESGQAATLRNRHRDWFVSLAEKAEPFLTGSEQNVWLHRLSAEHENLRAALEWATSTDPAQALRMACAMWRFWFVRGYLSEGRKRMELALEQTPEARDEFQRAKALNGLGGLAMSQGDYAAAHRHYDDSLRIRRKLNDRQGMAITLNGLGLLAWHKAEFSAARSLYEESLALRRDLGDVRGEAYVLNNLGMVAWSESDYDSASELYERALSLYTRVGDETGCGTAMMNLGITHRSRQEYAEAERWFTRGLEASRKVGYQRGIGTCLNDLAYLACQRGDLKKAFSLQTQSLQIKRDLGDRLGLVECIEGFAFLAAAAQSNEAAIRLWGAVESEREEMGAPWSRGHAEEFARSHDALKQAVGATRFDALWAEGRSAGCETALAAALHLISEHEG